MNKQQVLLQLFVRESAQQKLQSHESINTALLEDKNYIDWHAQKRDIVSIDVVQTHWIKTCTGGYITELVFHHDGTLNEYRLFDRFETHGTWSLIEGLLNVTIVKADNNYHFSMVGNVQLNIHSAVEHKNSELHSYLKFAQIK